MIIKFRETAPPNTLFEPDAFNENIGCTIPVKVEGKEVGTFDVLSATVIEEGRVVEFSGYLSDDIAPDLTLMASYRVLESTWVERKNE